MTGALLAYASTESVTVPFLPKAQAQGNSKRNYEPLVRALETWITSDPTRKQDFEAAINTAQSYNVPEMQGIQSLDDYLRFVNGLLRWIPTEAIRPKDLLFRTATMWFVLDQPSVVQYQSPIRPTIGADNEPSPDLTWLSTWMVSFSNQFGRFMDTPESAAELDTFNLNPAYHIDDYIKPRGGWKTFNEFFARHVKPGRRPIAGIADKTVVTCPADFVFMEMHRITPESTVTTKGLSWPITQMLAGSPYKDRFANGVWLHGFLNLNDYHRVHAPVAGTVLEARIIHGHNYMQFEAAPVVDPNGSTKNALTVPNDVGYHFCQSRGIVIMDTGFGLVAVVPVGMAVVSSFILTAEVGAELHKGEELGYFQFGGSDVVLIFESQSEARISMEKGEHYQMGKEIGRFGRVRE
ncbi:phosphatidylserine decarboxylase-domain-containing protein [Aspergillus desertorum]